MTIELIVWVNSKFSGQQCGQNPLKPDHRHSAMTTYELVISELNLSGVFKETTLITSQQKYFDMKFI